MVSVNDIMWCNPGVMHYNESSATYAPDLLCAKDMSNVILSSCITIGSSATYAPDVLCAKDTCLNVIIMSKATLQSMKQLYYICKNILSLARKNLICIIGP